MTSCENQQLIQSVFYLSSPFYVRGGPLEITGEASSGTEKKNHEAARKKSCRQVSWKKKFVHRLSGYFYFPLLNYHVAVMTEVFSLGANQESERLRPFGTGSVEQCALLYSFLGRHFLSRVYSFPIFIGSPRMALILSQYNGFSGHFQTLTPAPKVLPDLPLVGGYDDEFLNEVEDDLLCSICHLPLKDPLQTKCGHRCCKTCLDEHFKRFAFLINAK